MTSPTWTVDGWVGGATDDAGVAWTVEDEDGWSTSPPVRAELTDRDGADGSYDNPAFYSSRLVVLTGHADAPSQAAMLAAKERLLAVANGLRAGLVELEVAEATGPRSAWVRRADAKTKDEGARAFSWQLSLLAPDPRKYGPAATVASGLPAGGGVLTFPLTFPLLFVGAGGATGVVTVTNAGAYESWPTLRILGPVTDPVVENITTGHRLRLAPLSLGAGDYLDVDMDARSVLLNGSASRRGAVAADSDWWSLAPGDNAVRFGAAAYAAAAQLQLTYRPAWV